MKLNLKTQKCENEKMKDFADFFFLRNINLKEKYFSNENRDGNNEFCLQLWPGGRILLNGLVGG